MNTEDDMEEISETQGKIEPNAVSESIESRVVLPPKTVEDGSGDYFLLLETKETTSETIPDCVKKIFTENINEKSKQVGDGDKEMYVDKIDSFDSTIKEQTATSEEHFEEPTVPPNPTFLESANFVVSGEVDSENQDDELVLKWDDDDDGDGSIMSQKDEDLDNLDQEQEKSEALVKESAEIADINLDELTEKLEKTLNESSKSADVYLEQVSEKCEETLKVCNKTDNITQKQASELTDMSQKDEDLDNLDQGPEKSEALVRESAEIADVNLDEVSEELEKTLNEASESADVDLEQVSEKCEETVKVSNKTDTITQKQVSELTDMSQKDEDLDNLDQGPEKSETLVRESAEIADINLDEASEELEKTLNEASESADVDLEQVSEKCEETVKVSNKTDTITQKQVSELTDMSQKDEDLDNLDQGPEKSETLVKESAEITDINLDEVSEELEKTLNESSESADFEQVTEKCEETLKESNQIYNRTQNQVSELTDMDLDEISEKLEKTLNESSESADVDPEQVLEKCEETLKESNQIDNITQKQVSELTDMDLDEVSEKLEKTLNESSESADVNPEQVLEKCEETLKESNKINYITQKQVSELTDMDLDIVSENLESTLNESSENADLDLKQVSEKCEETLKESIQIDNVTQKQVSELTDMDLDEVSENLEKTLNESRERADVDLEQVSEKCEETLKESIKIDNVTQKQVSELTDMDLDEVSEKFEIPLKESAAITGVDLDQEPINSELILKESVAIDDLDLVGVSAEIKNKNAENIEKLKVTQKIAAEIHVDQDSENIKLTVEESSETPEIDLDQNSEKLNKIDLNQKEISEVKLKENAEINDFVQNEDAEMEFVEGIELKTSDDDADDDLDLLSEIDAQIAELGASISKAENEKHIDIDHTLTLTNKDIILNTLKKSESKEVISVNNTQEDNIKEIEKISTKNTQDEIVQKTKSKKEASEIEMEEALLADDILLKNKDNNTKTVDILIDSNKSTEIQMETDVSVNLKDLNRKEETPNNSEILANSTKLDLSYTEMETSCKDDTFANDSSSSIDVRIHGVNKPNVMLEIPTQELLDLDESVSSTEDKEMSMHENKTEDGNVSVDLTDDKDSFNESIEYSNDKKSLGKSLPRQEAILEEETILTEENKSKPEAPENMEKPNLIQDPDPCRKQFEPPESAKEENAVVEKEFQDNLLKSTKYDTATKLEQTALTEAESTTENCLPTDAPAIVKDTIDVQPSTSQAALQSTEDPSDDAAEVAEVTDSLGLLAESSFVRDDDDGDADGDDQETSDHDDDDDDYDPDDDSSNQQGISEDSTPHSETDTSKPSAQTTDTDKHFSVLTKDTDGTDGKEIDDKVTENDDAVKDVTESMEISATADQETEETEEIVDQETEEIVDQEVENNLDEVTEDNVDQGTGDIVDEETGEKEFGFEISNVVSQDEDVKEGDGDIDIDDEIVCGEVEVTENIPDTDQPAEDVDMTALQDIPTTDKAGQDIPFKVHTENKLRELLQKEPVEEQVKSPKKKLEVAQPSHEISIVEVDSSSDDESVQKPEKKSKDSVTSINISKEIEVMSSGDNTSEIVSKEGETIITVPKKTTSLRKIKSRLNTSEITIKTASSSESPTLVIPEAKMGDALEPTKPKFGALEVFNLDSDEEDSSPAPPARDPTPEPEPEKPPSKCINSACSSDSTATFFPADPSTAAYYDCQKKKRSMVCEYCLYEKVQRAQKLVEGIKNFTPLLDIEEIRCTQELVEISDSDSDDDSASDALAQDKIGLDKLPMLGEQLSEIINATWERFKMEARIQEAQDNLQAELDNLEKESIEVNTMLDECQLATDKLRSELYATFDVERHQLPGIIIHDTPNKFYISPDHQLQAQQQQKEVSNKRRLSSGSESQAKKPAKTLANTDFEKKDVAFKTEDLKTESDIKTDASKLDDDKDISVVQLSAEAAPADLPPPGETVRPPLQVNQTIFAMRHAFGSWIKARVLEVTPKGTSVNAQNFTMCRVKFENKSSRNAYKLLPARCLAYYDAPSVRMTIGTRVIALFRDTSADKSGKRESFYSGVVAEVPNPVNKYRYLVFFDDGYAQYITHSDTRLVCEFSNLVWEEVHPFSREFVKEYLIAYPERPMVRLHTGQSLKTEWNGKWWLSRVVAVDASLVQVYFEQDKRTEWIYRGSTRLAPLYLELQAAEKHRARPLPRNRMQNKLNMPYVEYTRLDEQQGADKTNEAQVKAQQELEQEIRRQRAVAKKSTTPANLPPQQPAAGNLDAVTSRVVYYTPKNAVKPYKMTPHNCSIKCRRTDVLALKDLRTYNPLAKPLLSGWERQIVRYKGHKEVMYRAPCGRRLRNMAELHRYLRIINSDMGVDLFDFGPNTHCLAEFVLNKCIVGKKDLSHGKENVPVPCVNYYDDSLPEFCSYNTERTPTAGVPLCLDPEFLCGCDCIDDCQDKSKCACWKMTLEGARTIGLNGNVGYVYKRLPEPLPSGIYECNSRCKCKQTCLNRVAQHPLQLKLQVFKTLNRGWGIRALNDVPKGSFLCIYAGNLLTDATANLDGLNEGDEYLAELDYIEVVEQMKEGYEDDIPEQDKKLDRRESGQDSESEETESDEEARNSKSDAEDGDFEPGYIPGGVVGFNKRLRKRDKKKQKDAENKQRDKDANREGGEDDCITISDDEEVREPSSFAAQAGMGGAAFISKYRSVRTLFGRDEACYIMDAKVQGNIGRYLNHSCSPNVFVQNVFVDTHDPRFPWVAFFALSHIRAGTELTWNYNYDVGSVPGKALYCYCGAPNCRGRLL